MRTFPLAWVCATALSLILIPSASATIYQGELRYENWGSVDTDLAVHSNDANGWGLFAEIAWTITDEMSSPPDFPWRYEYTVTVRKYELSHLVLETHATFTSNNITGVQVNGRTHNNYPVGLQLNNPGNPAMPSSIYGIKFDALPDGEEVGSQNVTHVISFFSDFSPAWGDIYLKGGHGNQAWNDGLTVSDNDPTTEASSGSYLGHLLVPGNINPNGYVVPEPSSLGLLAVGLWVALRR